MSPSVVWEETYRVRTYESGPDGRADLLTITHYLQESAARHAAHLDVQFPRLDEGGRGAWVLGRLRVEVERYPTWKEECRLVTWPSAAETMRARRDFLLYGQAEAVLARATTEWFVIDPARRRPTRLPASVHAIERPDRPVALAPTERRLDVPDPVETVSSFTVRRSELDPNGHANNTVFVEWGLEAVPAAFADAHMLRSIDILFRAEALRGDDVQSEVGEAQPGSDGGLVRQHLLRKLGAEGEPVTLALMESAWR